MKYKNFYDLHTHSEHSFDGNHPVSLMCESAASKGLLGIAITDHCEIDSKDCDFSKLCNNQYFDVVKCKSVFNGTIEVFKGIELGQAIYNMPLAESILDKYDYDFVLGSVHNLENTEDFFFLDYTGVDVYPLLEKYFENIYRLVQWNRFDSLAHLTYPLKYITGKYKIAVDLSRFSAVIDEILSLLIKNEKALEINTSGYFNEMQDILPSAGIVRRFKELGGKYITIGSDSHHHNRIGMGIEQGMNAAKSCGFDYITVYRGREPNLVEIK